MQMAEKRMTEGHQQVPAKIPRRSKRLLTKKYTQLCMQSGYNGDIQQLLEYDVINCLPESIKSLVESHNVDVNLKNHIGQTALHKAAIHGCEICSLTLIHLGAEVDARDIFDQTPLHLACLNAQKRVVNVLCEHGADPNASNKQGRQPLHECVDTRNTEAAATLLKYGGNASMFTTRYIQPLHSALISEQQPMLQVFLEHIILKEKQDPENITREYSFLLGVACRLKIHPAMHLVLQKTGIDPTKAQCPLKPNQAISLSAVKPLKNTLSIYEFTALILGLKYAKTLFQATRETCELSPYVFSKDNFPEEQYTFLLHSLYILGFKFNQEHKTQISNTSAKGLQVVTASEKHPLSLKNLCRNTIRVNLVTNPLHSVANLPLPMVIQNYLLLSDFEYDFQNI